MPTYEYVCRACGHRFDIVQKMSDDPLVICPECGGELRKVFAPPSISFKGPGFYATDHGKKRAPAASGDGKKKAAEGGDSKTRSGSTGSDGGSKEDSGSTGSSSSPGSSGDESS
jgi:putative FmdB family regulatory protein